MSIAVHARTNWFYYLVSGLLAIFIALLPAYTDIAKNAFYLLGLISLVYLVKNYRDIGSVHPVIKVFFLAIVCNFLWILITFYINGSPDRGSTFIWGRQFHLLLLIPLFFLFCKYRPSDKLIWVSAAISILLALYVGYQDIQVGHRRAQGGMHPILFGSIVLCISMFMLMVVIRTKNIATKLISAILFLIGIVLVVWTQSRGALIALPVLLLIIFWSEISSLSIKTRWSVALGFVLGLILMAQHPLVEKGIQRTIQSIQGYQQAINVDDQRRSTSLGTRFEMWRASWQIFLDNPVFGVGLGGYQQEAKINAEKYQVSKSAYFFYHPHNQYLSALSTRGILGGVLIMLLLVLPIIYSYSKGKEIKSKDYRTLLYVISAAYLIYGLSDVPLEGKATVLFYATVLAVLLSRAEDKQQIKSN